MTNNGWVKPVLIGVAIFVLGAVIVSSGSATFSNTVARRGTEVTVSALKVEVAENSKAVQGIDVMASQITDIKGDVRKILDKLDK